MVVTIKPFDSGRNIRAQCDSLGMVTTPCWLRQCIWCDWRQKSRTLSSSRIFYRQSSYGRETSQPFRFRRSRGHPRYPAEHDFERSEIKEGELYLPRAGDGAFQKNFKPGEGEYFSRKDDWNTIVKSRLQHLESSLHNDPIIKRLGLSPKRLDRHFDHFKRQLLDPSYKRIFRIDNELVFLLQRLRRNVSLKDISGLDLELKYSFFGNVLASRMEQDDKQYQETLLNLKHPGEWFPRTRGYHREFHVHVGPTNSGKTYHALKRLEEAERGVYAGPLRLLAHEVYMRLNARGKRCDLLTGDDRKVQIDNNQCDVRNPMISCTVEMLPVSDPFDVAVIDEIQMLGSEERGWAWTQALLGVMAKEVHVCGEERAVPIIQELVATCGDHIKVHRYERLSPLEMMPRSLEGDLSSLKKGDCIVGFSVVVLHSLRQLIETTLQRKCAIIYGSLPPETRTQQANLFNDPDNEYDFLVASNAVGMGLNLSIKRLIFQTAHRKIRGRLEAITVPEIKQIAGRAGRYSTASADMKASQNMNVEHSINDASEQATSWERTQEASDYREPECTASIHQRSPANVIKPTSEESASSPNSATFSEAESVQANEDTSQRSSEIQRKSTSLGLVTTLERLDYGVIAGAMKSDAKPIKSAGILPPDYIIERFARYFPADTPLSYLLLRLGDMTSTSRRFHLCDLKGQISIADAIEDVPNLTVTDRLIFCAAPIEVRRGSEVNLAQAYASLVGECRGASVLDFDVLELELLEEEYTPNREYLRKLEFLHKGIITFLWLSYRFTNVFLDQSLASHVKELTEARIEETLGKMSFDYNEMRKSRDQALLDLLKDNEDSREPAQSDQAVSRSSAADLFERDASSAREGLTSKDTASQQTIQNADDDLEFRYNETTRNAEEPMQQVIGMIPLPDQATRNLRAP